MYYIRILAENDTSFDYFLGLNRADDHSYHSGGPTPLALSHSIISNVAVQGGEMDSISDEDNFSVFIPSRLEVNSLRIWMCTEESGQELDVTIYDHYRKHTGQWRATSPTSSGIIDANCNGTWDIITFTDNAEDLSGWYFIEAKHDSGPIGKYKIIVHAGTTPTMEWSTEDNPFIICEDSTDPDSNDCMWDVMARDSDRTYLYRTAGILDGNNSNQNENWYLLDVPEGRRVKVAATGLNLTEGGSYLSPSIEIHSIKKSIGGNGYNHDSGEFPDSCPILRDYGGGFRVYGSKWNGNGYGSSKSSFLTFTALRSQQYLVKITAEDSTTGVYRLWVTLHDDSQSEPEMPPWD